MSALEILTMIAASGPAAVLTLAIGLALLAVLLTRRSA